MSLEFALLASDIGAVTTDEIITRLRERALRGGISDGAELKRLLQEEVLKILESVQRPITHPTAPPEVVMMVGVNGTGKTTTTGKLAALYRREGKSVLLCAADTFRAAAIEQLEVWSQRSDVQLIKTRQGGDPSAALFDALTAGKARGAQIVIVDTAGRLHTKSDLMKELDKMRRTAEKLVPNAPHQTLLVMDATTGQNGLQQARLFTEAARVTGIVLTKAGRHGEGRHRGGDRTRVGAAGAIRGCWREDRRHSAIRSCSIRGVATGLITEADLGWMRRALMLAREAAAFASPNPTVGCVLVREGIVLGEGAHHYDELDHAEIVALKQAGAGGLDVRGATAYVTLEPCSHYGRTGPCADALLAAGVARCVVATVDPNPLVRGNGVFKLRSGGVQMEVFAAESAESFDAEGAESATERGESVIAWEARRLNDGFAFAIHHGRPFVTLKAAVSVDGMLAPARNSRFDAKPYWLTGEAARADVQRLRHASDAILTGIGTVQADDPGLTDRTGLPRRRPLLRVVTDAGLRIALDAQLVRSADDDVLVLCGMEASGDREAQLVRRGVEVERLPERQGRVDLKAALQMLHRRGVRNLLAEGGAVLNGELVKTDLVDKAVLYYAPVELGADALPFAAGEGSPYSLQERLSDVTRVTFAHGPDEDVRVSGYLRDPWAGVA